MRKQGLLSLSWIPVVLVLSLGQVQSAEAQSAEQLERRIEELLPRLRIAEQEADLADSLRIQRVATDTTRVGPFTIVSARSQTEALQTAFEAAWGALSITVGESSPVLGRRIILFNSSEQPEGMVLLASDAYHFDVARPLEEGELEVRVRGILARLLGDGLPESMREWVGSTSLEVVFRDPRQVYWMLATTPSKATQRCFAGDVTWCWEAMGITESNDPWSHWYTEAERRFLVNDYSPYISGTGFSRTELRTLQEACLIGASQPACDQFLSMKRQRIPLTNLGPATLLAYALEIGGTGAYDRLLNNAHLGIQEAVAAAAQHNADSVLAGWRSRVIAARPEQRMAGTKTAATTILWIVVATTLAAARRTWTAN